MEEKKELPNLPLVKSIFFLISCNLDWFDKDVILLSLVMSEAVSVCANAKQL